MTKNENAPPPGATGGQGVKMESFGSQSSPFYNPTGPASQVYQIGFGRDRVELRLSDSPQHDLIERLLANPHGLPVKSLTQCELDAVCALRRDGVPIACFPGYGSRLPPAPQSFSAFYADGTFRVWPEIRKVTV